MSDVPLIGFQDGIEATRINLGALDPSHTAGYDKQAATLKSLKLGHNETWKQDGLADRLAAVEEAVASRPFFP